MAKSLLMGAVAACGCLLALSPAAQARGRDLNLAVLEELNFARTQPAAYARALAADADRPQTRADDPAAYEEAVDFLRRQRPLPALQFDEALSGAAQSHAALQARSGGFGHVGPMGETLSERLRRYGASASVMAEDISYGYSTPREVVRQLIVDSGVRDRGHRDNIFNPTLREAGVACGPHPAYRAMCVVDFSSGLMRR